MAKVDSMYRFFLTIQLPQEVVFEEEYSMKYEIKTDYKSENILLTRTLNFPVHGKGETPWEKYFRFDVAAHQEYGVILIALKNKGTDEVYILDIPLSEKLIYPPSEFTLNDIHSLFPVCSNYIHSNDTLYIDNFNRDVTDFFIYRYKTDFSAADPPMYRIKKNISKSMVVDSLFVVKAGDSFTLQKEALYLIQSDTSTLSGIGLRSHGAFYPKLASMEEIIQPVIYLTTKTEIDKLMADENKKEAFETFWLDMTKSADGAQWIIRSYFDRIEEANYFFTNYKEGWKTDMGMVFIILGPPDEVYKDGEKESWHYRSEGKDPLVIFNFLHIKSLFTDQQYMLIRDNQYKSYWYKAIDSWRKGRN